VAEKKEGGAGKISFLAGALTTRGGGVEEQTILVRTRSRGGRGTDKKEGQTGSSIKNTESS